MTKLSEQELKLLVSKFLEANPTDLEIEAFYINAILPHTKLSIQEITDLNEHTCNACGEYIDDHDLRSYVCS